MKENTKFKEIVNTLRINSSHIRIREIVVLNYNIFQLIIDNGVNPLR